MSSEYDPFSSPEFDAQYQNQTDAASYISGLGQAAVVDFGATVWNSLAPERYEVDTRDLLERTGGNALRVYDENPDTVHTASFIGGIFVPAGLALKGMNMARAGAKGAGWFSDAGKLAQSKRMEELFRAGPTATKEYNTLRRTAIARSLANNTLDSVAMEVAIIGSISAHPYMEDYWKDPASSFLTSVAIGGALGGALGHVADRFAIKSMEGAVASEAWTKIGDQYKAIIPGLPTVSKLQVQQSNISSLGVIAEDAALDPFVKALATDMLAAERASQVETFNALSKDLLQGTTKQQQEALLQKLADDPRFAGVDAIKYLHQTKEGTTSVYKITNAIFKNDLQTGGVKGSMAEFFDLKDKARVVAYSQAFDKIGSRGDISQISRAVDIGTTEALLKAGASNAAQALKASDLDASIHIWNRTSAEVDRLYLERLAHIDKLDAKKMKGVVIAPDDLPTLNGLVARAMRDPDSVAGATIKVTRNEPNYGVLQQQAIKDGGVKATHFKDLLEFTNPTAIKAFDMLGMNSSLSAEAMGLLQGWRSGSKVAEMRTAADAYFRGGYGGRSSARSLVEAMHQSKESVALRQHFAAQADADGNVYLWRGMKQTPRGHAALESYTTDINKAKEFGTPHLFKVHVDDILGAIADLKSSDGLMKAEIIVGAPARQIEAGLVVKEAGKVAPRPMLNNGVQDITYAEAHRMLLDVKEDTLNAMIAQGFPAEVMAIRTNTPVDTVKAYMAAGGTQKLDELELPYMEYTSASRITEYLGADKRTLLMRANVNKIPYAQMKANLDVVTMARMDQQIKASVLATSQSAIAKSVGAFFFAPERQTMLDILRAQVGKAVNELAGNKFLQSSDFFVRNMEEFGKISSMVGKQVQHLSNEAIGKMITPITEKMNAVAVKPVALAEFNTAMAFNAQLRGYRIYQDGQFLQKVTKTGADGKKVVELEPAMYLGKEYKVVSPEVDALIRELQSAGKEMYALKGTSNKILGNRPMSDLGFWVPAFNPTGKWITYAHDKAAATTKILWGNSKQEMDEAVQLYRAANQQKVTDGTLITFDKGQQELMNKFIGRDDGMTMQVANIEKQHSGASAPAIVKMNRDIFEQIAQSYEHYITASVRSLADISMSDITGVLARMSQMQELGIKNQPLTVVQRLSSREQNTARIMHNTLLGVSNQAEFATWQAANNTFETVLSYSASKISGAWNLAKEQLPKATQKALTAGQDVSLAGLDYKAFAKQLEAEGIVNPWQHFDDAIAAQMFGAAKLTESKNVGSRFVYASNALAATVALRFGEIAQPIVNAMSLPILTIGAIADRLPATFMGVQRGTAKAHPIAIMYEGVRAAFGSQPLHKGWDKAWEAAGYYKPLVSEATDTMRLAREFEPGALAKVERALDSNIVNWMSTPADASETMVRKVAMFTGGNLAKRLYPELDDVGVTIFARDFMDRVIGNYHAAQRPSMFGGTLGVAMGLFQTYMVTMAQSMYRHLELKNFKALSKMMLAQGTIFGAGSLPGFNLISEQIGEHFSDDNFDLVTGTYRAVSDSTAAMLLYGLPSSMGPAFYTRGELAPRVPTGVGEFPAFNMLGQALQATTSVIGAVAKADEDAGRALGQALSMQSISRPLARTSELATGYSVTRQGNTIAVPEEVWTPVGIMSRLMSTRPLEEAKLRDAIHLDTVYGSLDREERQSVTAALKTAIRNGTLDDAKVHELAEKYLRTGTPQGWRSAVNTALAQTNVSGKATFLEKLKPNNPFNHMIEMMDE